MGFFAPKDLYPGACAQAEGCMYILLGKGRSSSKIIFSAAFLYTPVICIVSGLIHVRKAAGIAFIFQQKFPYGSAFLIL